MGINCCSHSSEPPEITIIKPEKNMTSTNQNPIIDNQKNDLNNNNNIDNQIVIVEKTKDGTSADFTNAKFQKEFENAFTQPFDANTLYTSGNNTNDPLAFSKNEIDAVFNKGFQTVRKSFLITENNNNNINNNAPLNLNENINVNDININNQIIDNNNNTNNINIDEILKQGNQQNEQNQQQYEQYEQYFLNNQNIQNIQNEQNNENMNIQINKNENQIEKITDNIQTNQDIPNIQNNAKITTVQKTTEKVENVINQPNQLNQVNNDFDVDALIRNSEQNIHTNADMNLDIFFSQNNEQINDDLINKLFESAGKPMVQNSNNNQNPLFLSQQIENNQNIGQNLYNRYSPINSPQRSEISEPASTAKTKQLW